MAKLTGPLFSLEARGSLGPRLTFSTRKSGSQVRYQRAQADYTNDARDEQRARFWVCVGWWHDLSSEEKSTWLRLGRYI